MIKRSDVRGGKKKILITKTMKYITRGENKGRMIRSKKEKKRGGGEGE